jgi:riboflavin synthase
MFTGIVTACGTVSRVDANGDHLAITIEAPYGDLAPGESVAVNGACLTVVEAGPRWFRVEAVRSTRNRTRFGELAPGARVNLERAMAAGDRFGGHLVQGHVDGVGEVVGVRPEGDAWLVDVRVPHEVAQLTVLHGSIALDGVSLTVNALPGPGTVQVALIPYTREHTTLGQLKRGDRVHVEADVIGKYVRQVLRSGGSAAPQGGPCPSEP